MLEERVRKNMVTNIYNELDSFTWRVLPKEKYNTNSYRWKSWDANTAFAPSFDIQIWLDDLDVDISKELLKVISSNDNRNYRNEWLNYNIFNWDHKVFADLRKNISEIYLNYMSSLDLKSEELTNIWIRGWAVSLDVGDSIGPHCHGFHENSYLSGNISLSDIGTVTNYIIPHLSHFAGPWKAKNEIGRLTLFPSHVLHFVDPVPFKRYSVGFDIYHKSQMDFVFNNFNSNDKDLKSMTLSIPLNSIQ